MDLPNFDRLVSEINDLIVTNDDANAKQAAAAESQAALDVLVASTNAAIMEAQRQADELVAAARAGAATTLAAAQTALAAALAAAEAATDLRTKEIAFLQGMVAGQMSVDPTPN
jgi:hypothetical protein